MLNSETELEYKSHLTVFDKYAYNSSCAKHRMQAIEKLGSKCSICSESYYAKRKGKRKPYSLLHIVPVSNNDAFACLRNYYRSLARSKHDLSSEAYLICTSCQSLAKRDAKHYYEAKEHREQRHASFTPKVIRRSTKNASKQASSKQA